MKDMLKNKRIDDAELEKVSGGVDPSELDAFDTERYKEFSREWTDCFSRYSSNSEYQEISDHFWNEWKSAGFKSDAWTFLKDKLYKIMRMLS